MVYQKLNSLGDRVGELKKDLKEDLQKMEAKQDEFNKYGERLAIVEQSVRSAHHRLDEHIRAAHK